jgi:hypothetical protein
MAEIRYNLFQSQELQDYSSHFQIGVGKGSIWIAVRHHLGCDVDRELHAPYGWWNGFVAAKPNPICSKGAGITKADKVKVVGYQFADMGGTSCKFLDHCSGVQ